MLDTTEASVENALKRARAAVHSRLGDPSNSEPPPAPNTAGEREIVNALAEAFEHGDVDKLVNLLTADVRVTMPPMPLEYQGRELVERFFRATAFRPGRINRIVPTRANGQPALASYVHDPQTGLFRANGMAVLTLSGSLVSAMTGFDNSVLPSFGLPRVLP
jgi:RNA polymerase sigma-70 factor (ECF subfamily)